MHKILGVLNEEIISTFPFDLKNSFVTFLGFMLNHQPIRDQDKKSVILFIEKTQQIIFEIWQDFELNFYNTDKVVPSVRLCIEWASYLNDAVSETEITTLHEIQDLLKIDTIFEILK